VRYLILSDIHANLEALEAVLAHAEGLWDQSLVLGDLVGYGADPGPVIARVRELEPAAIIRGNHDKVACGIDDAREFNNVARIAAVWTAAQLSDEEREYLRALPQGPTEIDERVEICHGAPFDEDHYIFDAGDARRALIDATRGHSLI
jgi:predicted phosphodiesterase